VRVLIIGVDTPVGRSLSGFFTQRERAFVGLTKADCKWKSERQAKKALRRSACDIAIDCRIQAAADGGIKVHEIDVERTRWLAAASRGLKAPYMHLSCSRIYSGSAQRPYREADHPDGHSTIAELLVEAEQAVRDNCEDYLILRLGPVFSPDGVNITTHFLEQLGRGEVLKLSRQHQGCPVPVEDVTRVVSGIVDQLSCGMRPWGVYHYCSSDVTNCFEFAEVLLAAASQYRDIDDALVQELAVPEAPRLRELDCNLIRNTFAIKQQPWRANVAAHVKQYYARREQEEQALG
jgi:dTDP-4-dehydrorhamnose reductase